MKLFFSYDLRGNRGGGVFPIENIEYITLSIVT